MNPRSPLPALLALMVALGCGGCGGHGDADGHEDGQAHAGHVHQPKYGGTLVELGRHEGNVEVLLDPAAGKFTLYVLDAHAENFVRIPARTVSLVAEVGGNSRELVLQAVGNAATGETPGNTSQFEGTADWLKSAPPLTGRIPELTVQSKTYRDVRFQFSK